MYCTLVFHFENYENKRENLLFQSHHDFIFKVINMRVGEVTYGVKVSKVLKCSRY